MSALSDAIDRLSQVNASLQAVPFTLIGPNRYGYVEVLPQTFNDMATVGNAVTEALNPSTIEAIENAQAIAELVKGGGVWVTLEGALGNDATDNSLALQAAIDRAATGSKRVLVPEGIFRFSQTLIVDTIVQIVGVGGEASVLRYTGSGVALSLVPSTLIANNNMFWGLRDLRIDHATPGAGTGGVTMVTTGSEFLSNFEMTGCHVGAFGGPGLLIDNQTSPEMGSLFCFRIRGNFITNGIKIVKGGDSMSITDNTLHGQGFGIEASMVAGARQFVVRNNNITTLKGAFFDACPSVSIEANWFELPSYVGDYNGGHDGYLVLQNCPGAIVRRNTIQPLASVAVSSNYAVELTSLSTDVEFDGNEIATGETGHVKLGSAPRSLFRRNNREMGGGAFVFNGAHATAVNEIGNVPLLSAAQEWVSAQTFLEAPVIKKGTIDTQVVLEEMRWGTGSKRWEWVLMADASLGLYFYNAAGALISAFFFDQAGGFTAPAGLKLFDPNGQTVTLIAPADVTANRVLNLRIPDSDVDVTFPASGALATHAGAETLTNKRINPRVAPAQTGSVPTPTINTDAYDVIRLTGLTAAVTSLTTNLTGTPVHDQELTIEFTGTATRAIAHGTGFEASTVALPTTTSGTNMLRARYAYNSVTAKWRCIHVA